MVQIEVVVGEVVHCDHGAHAADDSLKKGDGDIFMEIESLCNEYPRSLQFRVQVHQKHGVHGIDDCQSQSDPVTTPRSVRKQFVLTKADILVVIPRGEECLFYFLSLTAPGIIMGAIFVVDILCTTPLQLFFENMVFR